MIEALRKYIKENKDKTKKSTDRMKKAFDRKKNAKGSDYKPGTRVPAVEESLMKKDNLG